MLSIMASPGEFKGQRKGSCGHIMAAFDLHDKCARCREKRVGHDPCVLGNDCSICEGYTDLQKEKLATPSYKIHKERKAGLLVSPKDVIVLGSVDINEQSSADSSAHPSVQAPASSSPSASHSQSFVTAEQFEAMNHRWSEQFARLCYPGEMYLLPLSRLFLLSPLTLYFLLSLSSILLPGIPVR